MAATNGVNTQGTISFDGLATGIKSSDTVDKIMQVEARPQVLAQAEQARLQNEAGAWQGINSKLLDLASNADTLWSASSWNTVTASTSKPSLLTASADATAKPGTYSFKITQLARNHQMVSDTYASDLSPVDATSLKIEVGGKSATIAIGAQNNTLSGVANAINQAKIGASASVINDGTSYRLVVSADASGEANKITVTEDGAKFALSDLQTPLDAKLTFGDAATPLEVKSSSNTVKGVVPGVTLNLAGADPNTAVSVTVSRDSTAIEKSIQSFVDSYNGAMGVIGSQFLYDDTTKTGGILMGDQTLVGIQDRLQSLLVSAVPTGGTFKSAQSVGLKLDVNGALTFDKTVFESAVATDYSSVEKLFRTTGQTDNDKISFVYAGKAAVPPPAGGYAVDITQAATRTVLGAGADVTGVQTDGSVTIGANEDALKVSLDGGNSFDVTLTAKTYTTLADLAAELQTRINAASTDGSQVAVTADGGKLQLTSQRYGAASRVGVQDGSANGALARLGLATATATQGLDVAGTIGGEAATGNGQLLRGNAGNAKTDGVEVKVALGADDVQAGAEARVTFTKGMATRFQDYLQDLTDPLTGGVQTAQNGIQQSLKDTATQIADLQTRLDTKRASLLDIYAKMESAIGNLNSQGSFLTQALAGLNTKSA